MTAKSLLGRVKQKRSKQQLRHSAHIAHHNRCAANRIDDVLVDPSVREVRSKGQGRWKCLLPQAYLRCAFSCPAQTERETGKEFKCSPTHAMNVKASASMLLWNGQREAISLVVEGHHRFAILTLMLDETTFKVIPRGEDIPTYLPLLALMGSCLWCRGDGIVRAEELIMPPVALDDKTASDECTYDSHES
eukprot:896938-Alexandrium_andersonii.AAC.1